MLADPRVPELHVVDAVVADPGVLTDAERLTSTARAAVAAGGGHVLEEALVRFPNGAITLVLVLAESHLSIHTWPEERRIAIDLFRCGAIDGPRVLEVLRAGLALCDVTLRSIGRGR